MRIRVLAILALLLSTPALGEPPIPDTPAGKCLRQWLLAYNAADRPRILAFKEACGFDGSADRTLSWREQTGGFTLLRIEERSPLGLDALLKERDSDAAARLELRVEERQSRMRTSMDFRPAPLPPELAVARLAQSQAVGALSARADQLAREDRFAGALLVARHEEILLQRAWGDAQRAPKVRATLDTRYRLGSMNKMFTAIATLQLVEAGKLALDDVLGKHLTDYPNPELASKVTVRHLLTHTGGTGDIFGSEFEANRDTLREHADYLRLFGSRGLTHPPGSEFDYSNYGYVLLGALIEQVSGQSYYDYVQANVFDPAGMELTGSLPESTPVPGRATGYTKKEKVWVSNADTLPYRGMAAGGGYSTVGDLLKFARALQSGKLVSAQTLAEATARRGSQEYGYGFGFEVRGEGALLSYGHGGGAPGMNGDLRIFPELGYVLIGLSNLDPPAAGRLVDYFALRMPVTP